MVRICHTCTTPRKVLVARRNMKVGGDALCHHYQPSLAYFVSGQTAEQVKSKSGNTVGQSHPSLVPDRIGEFKN